MSAIDKIKAKAKANVKHIVLPEGTEPRTVQASAKILAEGLAKVTLIGNPEEVAKVAAETGTDLTPVKGSISKFADRSSVSSWAVEGVGALAANGIMNGTSATQLSPKATCTVEQSILLSFRTFEKLP